MVILSLFDGMSCGQIALKELGVTIDKYYASEIDKFAIQNTMANFPDTVQLGDVRQVDAKSLGKIDLLIGGSPCQCFSFAGKIKDILQDEVDEKYFLSPEYVEKLLAYNKRQEEHGNGFKAIFHKETDKMCTLTVGGA